MLNNDNHVLMLWRHRFIPDAWGWELPAGVADTDDLTTHAIREAEEETGWHPHNLRPLLAARPGGGLSDAIHHVFWTDHAEHIGTPQDDFESTKIEWVPLQDVPTLIDRGEIQEASTVAALLRLYLQMIAQVRQ